MFTFVSRKEFSAKRKERRRRVRQTPREERHFIKISIVAPFF